MCFYCQSVALKASVVLLSTIGMSALVLVYIKIPPCLGSQLRASCTIVYCVKGFHLATLSELEPIPKPLELSKSFLSLLWENERMPR